MSEETYLGDGLYASFDGHMIKLRVPRGSDDHEIYLDPYVYAGLVRYAERLFQSKREDQPKPVQE